MGLRRAGAGRAERDHRWRSPSRPEDRRALERPRVRSTPRSRSSPTARRRSTNSALVIGSKEVFQKAPEHRDGQRDVHDRAGRPRAPCRRVTADYLAEGTWVPLNESPVSRSAPSHVRVRRRSRSRRSTMPDLTPDVPYSTTSRAGFIRLKLDGGFGTDTYPVDVGEAGSPTAAGTREPTAPVLPTVSSLTLDYIAAAAARPGERRPKQAAGSSTSPRSATPSSRSRPARPACRCCPSSGPVPTPAEGELYIGVRDLHPPQNLALLFQVVDGTANPLVVKPEDHIHWTYLRDNEWVPFAADAVADGTDGLLASGIVTLAVPADATTEHTLLPAGMHWIRLAVASESDAVCRLVTVAAQALRATYVVPDNGSTSHTAELPPGTITKLDPPDAAVKGVDQPFPTFGGRPVETTVAFATRVSERLRHKDRAIALWDYEHLILEAFPGIYQARCLNHTQYEPSTTGTGIYRELAPGHVTVVTIPDRSGARPARPAAPVHQPARAPRDRAVPRRAGVVLRHAARAQPAVRGGARRSAGAVPRRRRRDLPRQPAQAGDHRVPLAVGVPQRRPPDVQRQGLQVGAGQLRRGAALRRLRERRPPVPPAPRRHRRRSRPGGGGRLAGDLDPRVRAAQHQHGVHPIHPDEVVVPEHCACAPAVT